MAPCSGGADPLDVTEWVLGFGDWDTSGRVLAVGESAAAVARGLRRHASLTVTGLLTDRRSERPSRPVLGRAGAWPVRAHAFDAVVLGAEGLAGSEGTAATGAVDLSATAAEVARALSPTGSALVVLLGPGHHGEVDELLRGAGADPPKRRPPPTVEEASTALSPHLVVEHVARWSETRPLEEPRRLLGAIQSRRPQLLGRLSGFTNWTMVLARAGAALEAAAVEPGGLTITVDATVLRCRPVPAEDAAAPA